MKELIGRGLRQAMEASSVDLDFAMKGSIGVGLVGIDGVSTSSDLLDRAFQLRADVYVHDRKWLPASSLDAMGRESDEHDAFSTHLLVVDSSGILAYVRIISSGGGQLPFYRYVGDHIRTAVGENAVEISRLIRNPHRPDDPRTSDAARLLSLVSMSVALRCGVDVYALAEPALARWLNLRGVVHEIVASPQEIPEFGNSENAALRLDPHATAEEFIGSGVRWRRELAFLFDETRPLSSAEIADHLARRWSKK